MSYAYSGMIYGTIEEAVDAMMMDFLAGCGAAAGNPPAEISAVLDDPYRWDDAIDELRQAWNTDLAGVGHTEPHETTREELRAAMARLAADQTWIA